jgi:biopolymer transport protein ExbD
MVDQIPGLHSGTQKMPGFYIADNHKFELTGYFKLPGFRVSDVRFQAKSFHIDGKRVFGAPVRVWHSFPHFYGNMHCSHLKCMTEIIESGKKTKKRSTRVDLTPMVDLGFLLITFFIFTTAMSKPTGMKFFLPKSVPDKLSQPTPASGVLTLLLAADKRIFYYEGADPRQLRLVEANGIRRLILDKKKRTSAEKFMVIIKPGKDSNFKTLVNVMDEMTINEVRHYAMVDPEPTESSLMNKN